ncbi:MAG: HAMP domain-containing histidine kinase [Actinomycetota bacterium]|nr:HAMP domain-containing histidine kinase [Actinomycetota bacterium]
MVGPSWSPRRIAVVVVLVASVVGAALAMVVFVLVRDARLRDSLERARAEAVFDLRLADDSLLADTTNLQQAVESYEDRGIHAVLFLDGEVYRSDPSFGIRIPRGLRDLADGGQLGFDRMDVGGDPTLVVGGPTPGRDAELYFAFPEGGIQDDLRELGVALAIGWVAIVVVAFALARVAAGRIATLAEAEAWGRRFTSDVSHELRTPVAALVSEASVLEEHLERMPPEARRAAELLVGDVGRLRRLIEDLTSLASLDTGREEVHLESLDLHALIDGTVRSRGWQGRIAIRSEPVTVTTDRSRVDRIVANLIGNALDHGRDDVAVQVGRDAEGPFVEVADAGPGIAPEHLPHLFDRFYRADAARSGPGSGLGLAIARENARLVGGDVEVRSEPGTGSRFTLRLPGDRPVAEP